MTKMYMDQWRTGDRGVYSYHFPFTQTTPPHPTSTNPTQPYPTSLDVSNRSGDHLPRWWKENACLLFRSGKLKFFHSSRTNTVEFADWNSWRSRRRLPLQLCRWTYFAKLKIKKENIPETSSGKSLLSLGITETHLFKYIEKFTTKTRKIFR